MHDLYRPADTLSLSCKFDESDQFVCEMFLVRVKHHQRQKLERGNLLHKSHLMSAAAATGSRSDLQQLIVKCQWHRPVRKNLKLVVEFGKDCSANFLIITLTYSHSRFPCRDICMRQVLF